MKKYILIITALLLILGCRSRSVRHLTTAKLPEISKEKEVFDEWHLFPEFLDSPSNTTLYSESAVRKGIRIVNKGNKTDTFTTRALPFVYSEYDKNGVLVFDLHKSKDSSIYSIDYRQNLYFGICKVFYPNGNIKKKGLLCYFRFNVGEWYHFDENGNLMYSENTDEGYSYSYEKVFRFCKKYNIPLERRKFTYIYKTDGNWRISYSPTPFSGHDILLDGKTGKEISNEIYEVKE